MILPLFKYSWYKNLAVGLLFLVAGCLGLSARTNELYVESVVLDEDQHIDLLPGDPIRYTVTYGREAAAAGQQHQLQIVRVRIYLSTDGNPDVGNLNNFLLEFFDDSFPAGATAADLRQITFINKLPPNFTGTYYLVAKITPGGGDPNNDFPDFMVTGSARITIRPYDSALVSRVSETPAGVDANELSESPSISNDGRYVVFQSEATNLVSAPVAPAGIAQIYLKDNLTGEVRMISQLGGVAGNAESRYPVISANGDLDPTTNTPRFYIAYQSAATNLVAGNGINDTNQQTDVFLYDVASGVTKMISVPTGAPFGQIGNGGSFLPSISGDGRLIAFESRASNLLGKNTFGNNIDTNGRSDIFVYNRINNVVVAASSTSTGVLGNGDSMQARISEDGSTVVFRTYAGNLGAGVSVALPYSDVVAKTLSSGRINRISTLREPVGSATLSRVPFNRDSYDPVVSKDGRFVAFASRSTNPTAPDGSNNTSGVSQVYVVNRAVDRPVGGIVPANYDMVGNTSLHLVSVGVSPLNEEYGFGDNESLAPTISADGQYIGYMSEASNLQPRQVVRSDGRVFQSKNSGLLAVFPNNTGVVIDTPQVVIEDATGAGNGAVAVAVVQNGQIVSVNVQNGGQDYATGDGEVTVRFEGGGGNGARATININDDGEVTAINVTNGGNGYAFASLIINGGVGDGAVAVASLDATGGVSDILMTSYGYGYATRQVEIDFSEPEDPDGVKPTAIPLIENSRIYDIILTSPGSGYQNPPVVFITGLPQVQAEGEVSLSDGRISQITITNTGAGYVTDPDVYVVVSDSNGTAIYPDPTDPTANPHFILVFDGLGDNAISRFADFNSTSDVYIRDTGIQSIVVADGGSGYTDSFLISDLEITGGGGYGAVGYAIVENGRVERVDMINRGAAYLVAPSITLPAPAGGVAATLVAVLPDGSDRVSVSHYGQETIGLIGGFEVPSSRSLNMSSNGRYMLFTSEAANNSGFIFGKSNQIPLDQNSKRDVFMVDRRIGAATTPVLGEAPTVTLTMGAEDVTFNSTRVISVVSFDAGDISVDGAGIQTPIDGAIRRIEIYANNRLIATSPGVGTESSMVFDTTWTAPQLAGPAQIYAVAIDGNGNRSFSAPVLLQVVAPVSQRPTVALASSVSTLNIGASVILSATVTDPENQIGAVRFYSNGQFLGAVPGAPYQFTFTPSASGTYRLVALVSDGPAAVVDENGNILLGGTRNDALSNELTLRVLPPPSPTVSINLPAAALTQATIGQPVFLEIVASTTNPNASIATVIIKENGIPLAGTAVRDGISSTYRFTWIPNTTGAKTIVAVATDSQQGTADSAAKSFQVNAQVGLLPNVSVNDPTAGSGVIFTSNTAAVLSVSASDPDGSITAVQFYANGALLGNAAFNPASGRWELIIDASLLSAGAYDIVAIAVDNDGNHRGSTAFQIIVATAPPTAAILTPTLPAGTTVLDVKRGQPLPILVQAISADSLARISSVNISVDGVVVGSASQVGTTNEFALIWTPTDTGVFKLLATASDTKGGTVQTLDMPIRVTEPIGSEPVVAITSPVAGEGTAEQPGAVNLTSGSSVLVNVASLDADGKIVALEIFLDGKSIGVKTIPAAEQAADGRFAITRSMAGLSLGRHVLVAIATDDAGNKTISQPVALNVVATITAPPTLTLAGALPSRITVGQSLNVFATATASTGASIVSVEFFANGASIGAVAASPYSLAFTPPSAGIYEFRAVATDSVANQVVSTQIVTATVVEDSSAAARQVILTAYQNVLGRAPTTAEIQAAIAQFGEDVTVAELSAALIGSTEFRDSDSELILTHLAIWGDYPSPAEFVALRALRNGTGTDEEGGAGEEEDNDVTIVDALLNSPEYTSLYGSMIDLTLANGNQYAAIRALAIRTYRNVHGVSPNTRQANIIAQQFYYSIATSGLSPGQAIVSYVNATLEGGKDGPLLAKLRLAGTILFVGNREPTAADMTLFRNLPIPLVADYLAGGGVLASTGSMVTINTSIPGAPTGTTYHASGLPAGLTINPTTGVISGRIPGVVRTYTITTWTQQNGVRSASKQSLIVVKALDTDLVGTFQILLEDTIGLPAGRVQITVDKTSAYTGVLYYRDGKNYTVRGVLQVAADDSAVGTEQTIVRRGLDSLVFNIALTSSGDITATVKEGLQTFTASGIKTFLFTARAPAPWRGSAKGVYNLNLDDVSAAPTFPASAGKGTVTVAVNGALAVRLRGADSTNAAGTNGTPFTGSFQASLNSEYQIYIRPYTGVRANGYFAGWLQLSEPTAPALVTVPAPLNELYWFRPAGGTGVWAPGFGPLSIQPELATP